MLVLHEAYILHSRAFSDSKALLEILTKSLGKVKAVARVPAKKNRAQFQLFHPLLLALKGAGELKTLTQCEFVPNKRFDLKGESLFCAMYINELVQRLVSLEDADTPLFCAYESALASLTSAVATVDREAVLRRFELDLLASAGYGINFDEDSTGAPLLSEGRYVFGPQSGFDPVADHGFAGTSIAAIGERDFSQAQSRRDAKQITRAALRLLLGDKPIKSRELFR